MNCTLCPVNCNTDRQLKKGACKCGALPRSRTGIRTYVGRTLHFRNERKRYRILFGVQPQLQVLSEQRNIPYGQRR